MAAAFDSSGSGALTAAGTTYTINITSAATGADCFAFIAHGASTTTWTSTGWTQIGPVTTASTLNGVILYRRKVAGDTSFTITASTSAKGTHGWVSFTGLDATTPYQAASNSNFLLKNGSSTAVSTPSLTNADAADWALGFFASRSSTSGNKAITWTPDAALTERVDANNSGASSSVWTGIEIAGSNGAVTAAAHSYTATASFAETYGIGALLYLSPATSGVAALTGRVTATSTVSGTPTEVAAFAGTAAATSSASGMLTGVAALASATMMMWGDTWDASWTSSPTLNAVSGVTGNLTLPSTAFPLAGTVAAVSGVSGAIKGISPFAGTLPAVSGASGALTGVAKLAGTNAAIGSVTGALRSMAAFAGSAASTSGASGSMTGVSPLAGTTAGVSGVTGNLAGVARMTGTVAATSGTAGALSLPSTPVALGGTIAATSTAAGELTAVAKMGGTVAATSTASGTLRGVYIFGGTTGAATASIGTLTAVVSLTGSVAANAASSGEFVGIAALGGTAMAATSSNGALTGVASLASATMLTWDDTWDQWTSSPALRIVSTASGTLSGTAHDYTLVAQDRWPTITGHDRRTVLVAMPRRGTLAATDRQPRVATTDRWPTLTAHER